MMIIQMIFTKGKKIFKKLVELEDLMNLLKNPRNKNKWKLKDILYWRWHSTINLMTAGQYIKEKYMILPIILDIILEARKFY